MKIHDEEFGQIVYTELRIIMSNNGKIENVSMPLSFIPDKDIGFVIYNQYQRGAKAEQYRTCEGICAEISEASVVIQKKIMALLRFDK